MNMITMDTARELGFTVDTCAPGRPIAYRGARFSMTEHVDCFTELEVELMKHLRAVLPYAESRAEDLVEFKSQGLEDSDYPGADEACAKVEAANTLMFNLAP